MSYKKWWMSRGIWLGVMTFLVGAIPFVIDLIKNGQFDATALLTSALGILKVLQRATSTGATLES